LKRIAIACTLAVGLTVPATAGAEKPTKTDKQNASEQCRELRTGMGEAAFNQLYGTNKNDENAFGKCVSKFAKEEQQERKAAKSEAQKDCKAEQDADEAAFDEKYGTGKNGKNAYGKCVSTQAKENKERADKADEAKDENRVNAAKECREEQKADAAAFKETYGTNANKSNAFGKCVSAKAKAQNDES